MLLTAKKVNYIIEEMANLRLIVFLVSFFVFCGFQQKKKNYQTEETIQFELQTQVEHNTGNVQTAFNVF